MGSVFNCVFTVHTPIGHALYYFYFWVLRKECLWPATFSTPVSPPTLAKPAANFAQPFNENSDIKDHMNKIWEAHKNGQGSSEGSFVIHGRKPDGSPVLRDIPDSEDYHKERFSIMPGDKAIIHTHPDLTDPKPSEADREIADKNGLDMYTLSNGGLYLYRKGMKEPQRVYNDTSFLSPPKVDKFNEMKDFWKKHDYDQMVYDVGNLPSRRVNPSPTLKPLGPTSPLGKI